MLVPSWARANANDMKKTPALVPDPPPSRKRLSRSRGFQIGSLYITVDDEETIMPTKEVKAKPQGMANN
jgi:hypothetical protein